MAIANRAIDNLQQFIEVDPVTGCWKWQGATDSGYGRVTIDGKRYQVHRLMYEIYKGPIGPGLLLDHLCHSLNIKTCTDPNTCPHRRCCNPAHLEPVSVKVNTKRGLAGKRTGKRANRRY